LAEIYEVVARVVSQKGTCDAKHKVGDEWVIGTKTPEGMCLAAFYALIPSAWALMFGGSFPWGADPGTCTIACPDVDNPVVFELRRLQK